MRYALVNNEQREAEPGLSGVCRGCGQPMIAKCGDRRVHHWAHLGMRTCDPWWEPETQWHRVWKGRFPEPWQEVILRDKSGEKHIADVRTEHGLVLEFQHSPIRSAERQAREAFYGNMIWVVDGMRRKRDLARFKKGRLYATPLGDLFTTPSPDECFPSDWLDSRVLAFFDFGDEVLWGLLPGRAEGHAAVVALWRENLIQAAHRQSQILASEGLVLTLAERFRAKRLAAMRAARLYPSWRPRHRSQRRTPRFG